MPCRLSALLLLSACTPPPAPHPVGEPSPAQWQQIRAEIRQKFTEVAHLDTAAVEALQARDKPLVLDLREPAEFAVSHLPGARSLPLGQLADRLSELPRDRSILVYCSVGYRSAMAAQRLQEAGWTRVHNYLGSIFAWANAGKPLVNAAGSTDKVHPYDDNWGRMLRREAWQR